MILFDMLTKTDCLRACVASRVGIRPERVPDFAAYQEDNPLAWWHLLVGYMAAQGLSPYSIDDPGDAPGEVVFVTGPSPRGPGLWHCVLYRDGRLLHDPHPSRLGVLAVSECVVWRLT